MQQIFYYAGGKSVTKEEFFAGFDKRRKERLKVNKLPKFF